MQEIIFGVALFTGIVLLLAVGVLIARASLLPTGNVTIIVNNDRELHYPAGGKLLAALMANEVFIPAACGGNGSCGQCRVTVQEGGGELLPIESSFINKRAAASGQRLACQVALHEQLPLRINLPEALFTARRLECKVHSNRHVATYIKELVLTIPKNMVLDFHAGDFIQIDCPPHTLRYADFDVPAEYSSDWQRSGLLQLESAVEQPVSRAYSIANYPQERDDIVLNIRIATPPPAAPLGTPPGIMSSYLFGLQPGATLNIAGPFGEFYIRPSEAEIILVGGGAGMAPLRSHAFDQLIVQHSKRKISFWYGARSLREAFYSEQFERLAADHENFEWHLALSDTLPEDNWTGYTGLIHEVLLEHYLKQHPAPEDCEFYLCGPPMMIAALTNMLDELGVEEENIFFDDFGS